MRIILTLLAALILSAPLARADIGGEVPGPGGCEYPGVGRSGQAANVYWYYCDFPTEINGAHWHVEMWGVDIQGAVNANLNFPIVSFGGQLSGQIGGIFTLFDWRCPNNTLADPPNPPGAWKNYMPHHDCKTVSPAPSPGWENAQPPPNVVPPGMGAVQSVMGPNQLPPAQTDPVAPNSLQQEDRPR